VRRRWEAAIDAMTTLESHPASASAARSFVRTWLKAWGCEHIADAAVLLTSELVTNAIRHAEGDIELRMRCEEHIVRVEVRDGNPDAPQPRSIPNDATSGRGLTMVEVMAGGWGVQRRSRGKTVWFELPV
jgi:anti-sigma regulatory factor (Ser/Thr protein kinase)